MERPRKSKRKIAPRKEMPEHEKIYVSSPSSTGSVYAVFNPAGEIVAIDVSEEEAISYAVVRNKCRHGWVTMAASGWKCVTGEFTQNEVG